MPAPIFDKKEEVGRQEFREALRKRLKAKTPQPKYSFQDKMKIEKNIFGPTYIEKISLDDYKKALRKMDRLKLKTRTEAARKAIDEKLQYLLRIGGQAKRDLKRSYKTKEVKQVKEQKKDTSAFKGNPWLTRERVRQWLRGNEAWRITKIPAKQRPALEKKIFDPKRFGSFIDRREASIVSKDFENYPTRAKSKYGMKSRSETIKTRNLLRKFLGK